MWTRRCSRDDQSNIHEKYKLLLLNSANSYFGKKDKAVHASAPNTCSLSSYTKGLTILEEK
jgi:hypothetical protein